MTNIENLGNKEIFAKNLSNYLKTYNKDSSQVCKDLNIPPSTFSDWLNAKKYPRMDKLEMLANYFNIKKSDLIEDRDDNPSQTQILFDKAKDILSDDDRETIELIMQKAIDKYQNENK